MKSRARAERYFQSVQACHQAVEQLSGIENVEGYSYSLAGDDHNALVLGSGHPAICDRANNVMSIADLGTGVSSVAVPEIKKAVSPISKLDGRYALSVPLEVFNVGLGPARSRKQLTIELDEAVSQTVVIDGQGGLCYELAPFLRDLLLGITAEGESSHTGGSSISAIRGLRAAQEEPATNLASEHASLQLVPIEAAPKAIADTSCNALATTNTSILPHQQQGSANIPQSLIVNMPVERLVIDPNGTVFLCSPESWNAGALTDVGTNQQMALEDYSAQAMLTNASMVNSSSTCLAVEDVQPLSNGPLALEYIPPDSVSIPRSLMTNALPQSTSAGRLSSSTSDEEPSWAIVPYQA